MILLESELFGALLCFVFLMPGWLLGHRRRTRRRASDGVKDVLTWPRRRQGPRYAEQDTRTWERDKARPAAGTSTWAPALAAAMPTDRCNACPVWGCARKGVQAECEVHPYRPGCRCESCLRVTDSAAVYVYDRPEPVAHVPTAYTEKRDLADAISRLDASQLDYLVAMMGARRARPGDDETAKPPRDEFDAALRREPPPDRSWLEMESVNARAPRRRPRLVERFNAYADEQLRRDIDRARAEQLRRAFDEAESQSPPAPPCDCELCVPPRR